MVAHQFESLLIYILVVSAVLTIALLNDGDAAGADARLIEAAQLQVATVHC